MQQQKSSLQQSQKLRQNLSPRLIHSIKLMALPTVELAQAVREELERNPLLEMSKEESDGESLEQVNKESEEESVFANSSDPGKRSRGSMGRHEFIEQTVADQVTLKEHLLRQLYINCNEDTVLVLGERLIENLDNDGFHREDPRKLTERRYYPQLETAISMINQFDPVGCCSSDYVEALQVQIKYDNSADANSYRAMLDYPSLVIQGNYKVLARKMAIDREAATAVIEYVKTLQLFPGRRFSRERQPLVIPDVQVTVDEQKLTTTINDDSAPQLEINRYYAAMAGNQNIDNTTRLYIKEQLGNARWFIKSLQQRNQTLEKLTQFLVEAQRDFFIRGPEFLKPLLMSRAAEEIGVHEATVSRIANSRYLQTDWGIFPVRYFFSKAVGGGNESKMFSKRAIKEILRQIVEQESGKISDQKIADILAQRGITIARRTVAKYRQELKISSSFYRRVTGKNKQKQESNMEYILNGIHHQISQEEEERIEKKMKHLSHYESSIEELTISIILNKKLYKAESNIHLHWGAKLHCSAEDYNSFTAIDMMFEKLTHQLAKEKSKIQEHRK